MAEWFLFLPQLRFGIEAIVARASAAESAGFDGIAFIDHLEPPAAADQPIWEAMTLATWVAAHTERLRIGHLVLCDAFRHPAVLAKQAVTLSAVSGGRFELGLGSGSWPAEFTRFGLPDADDAKARAARLARDVAIIRDCWGCDGETPMTQKPLPPHRIPLLFGGTGKTTLALARQYGDWWNIPSHQLDRLPALAPAAGAARVSLQQMVGFVPEGEDAAAIAETSKRRFGYLGTGLVCGDAAAMVEHFAALADRGVARFYVWFADFAPPAVLHEFAETVITPMSTR